MKKYSYIVVVVIATLVCAMFTSCNTKKKKTEKLDSQIEKLLLKREFDKARELTASYPYQSDGEKQYYRITRAQLSLMIDDSQWNDAASLAKELNSLYAYEVLFKENFSKLLTKQQYDVIVNNLSDWQDYPSFNNYRKYTWHYQLSGGLEINEYNDLVDKLLQHAIMNENVGLIKKCLVLYRVKKESNGRITYDPKVDARKQVKEAGIKID